MAKKILRCKIEARNSVKLVTRQEICRPYFRSCGLLFTEIFSRSLFIYRVACRKPKLGPEKKKIY